MLSSMARVSDLPLVVGRFPSGPTASVLDVPGAGLGHATVWRDEPGPPRGRGVARTGVTVLLPVAHPYRTPVPAGGAVLNGAGECTGFLAAGEWGLVESPVFLTSTMQLGRVYDAACELMLEEDEGIGEDVVIPVVAECDDSHLSDARRMQVTRADVEDAYAAARASVGSDVPPEQGAVGAGTGMSCLGFKGGIGTASRVLPTGHVVGVLLLTNFGTRERLTIGGVPVGRLLPGPAAEPTPPDAGSCVGVVVTDAPVDAAGCARLARRVGLGLGRVGSVATHGSGEIFLAMSTAMAAPRGHRSTATPLHGNAHDDLFEAVVDATEEAVVASLLASPTVTGRGGHVVPGLDVDAVRDLLTRWHGTPPRADPTPGAPPATPSRTST
jgi:D-aminopeptidase